MLNLCVTKLYLLSFKGEAFDMDRICHREIFSQSSGNYG